MTEENSETAALAAMEEGLVKYSSTLLAGNFEAWGNSTHERCD